MEQVYKLLWPKTRWATQPAGFQMFAYHFLSIAKILFAMCITCATYKYVYVRDIMCCYALKLPVYIIRFWSGWIRCSVFFTILCRKFFIRSIGCGTGQKKRKKRKTKTNIDLMCWLAFPRNSFHTKTKQHALNQINFGTTTHTNNETDICTMVRPNKKPREKGNSSTQPIDD